MIARFQSAAAVTTVCTGVLLAVVTLCPMLASAAGCGVNNNETVSAAAEPVAAEPVAEPVAGPDVETSVDPFPKAWHGMWTGEMLITAATAKSVNSPQRVPISLRIEPIENSRELTWMVTYDPAGKKLVKDYRLQTVDAASGRFQIDEQNGIVLPARLVGNVMYCLFEVDGQYLTARYEQRDETLLFEVTSAKPLAEKTGAGAVQPFSTEFVQSAAMKREPAAK